MSDLVSTSPSPAGSGAGLDSGSGLAHTAPAGSVSPPTGRDLPATTAPVPSAPGLPASPPAPEKDTTDWKKRYDDTRTHLESLGGLDTIQQRMRFLEGLTQDPAFMKWASERLAAQQTGQETVDPDTMKALTLVRSLAQQEAAQMVAPLHAQALAAKAKAVFAEMDKQHEGWQALKPQMLALHQRRIEQGLVNKTAELSFDYDYVADLYRAVAARDPEWGAREYQRSLTAKQANVTTASPGTAPSAVGQPKAGSLREAYAQAKRQHGLA